MLRTGIAAQREQLGHRCLRSKGLWVTSQHPCERIITAIITPLPLEVFLYDWWPNRARAGLYDRLAPMPVRVQRANTNGVAKDG